MSYAEWLEDGDCRDVPAPEVVPPSWWVREALRVLQANLEFARSVDRRFDRVGMTGYTVGSVVTVRRR